MKKFLDIIISVIILFTTFIGVIYVFALSLVNFALCLPIILVMVILYFLKQKTKNK